MYICFVYIIENDSRLRTHTRRRAGDQNEVYFGKKKRERGCVRSNDDMQNEFIRRQSVIFILTENIRCLYTYRHTADIEDFE